MVLTDQRFISRRACLHTICTSWRSRTGRTANGVRRRYCRSRASIGTRIRCLRRMGCCLRRPSGGWSRPASFYLGVKTDKGWGGPGLCNPVNDGLTRCLHRARATEHVLPPAGRREYDVFRRLVNGKYQRRRTWERTSTGRPPHVRSICGPRQLPAAGRFWTRRQPGEFESLHQLQCGWKVDKPRTGPTVSTRARDYSHEFQETANGCCSPVKLERLWSRAPRPLPMTSSWLLGLYNGLGNLYRVAGGCSDDTKP